MPRPQVVIVGGGFGGLAAAKALRDVAVDVILIDRRNHHLFQPLLYQVATGALSPANIAVPLRRVLRRYRNVRVLLGEVEGIDLSEREVVLAERRVPFDYVVVAAGATNQWFGHDEWAEHAPGLKSIADATGIRARILHAFEQAELVAFDPELVSQWLSFMVIGGGPTGVEMAGAIAELARDTLRHDFRAVDTRLARILLVEGAPQILPAYRAGLAGRAQRALERLGVEVRTGTVVTEVDGDGVTLRRGEVEERVSARTAVWGAGVRAVPLAARLATAAGVEVDRGGRVPVGADLTVAGHADVYVIGDMAAAPGPDGRPLPGLAPVAMQEGQYVAAAIAQRVAGRRPPPFAFHNPGTMATVGRGFAVFKRGRVEVAGFLGWLGWLFIHLLQVTEFENRLLVLTQWAWSYVTRNRSARLIVRREDEREAGA